MLLDPKAYSQLQFKNEKENPRQSGENKLEFSEGSLTNSQHKKVDKQETITNLCSKFQHRRKCYPSSTISFKTRACKENSSNNDNNEKM